MCAWARRYSGSESRPRLDRSDQEADALPPVPEVRGLEHGFAKRRRIDCDTSPRYHAGCSAKRGDDRVEGGFVNSAQIPRRLARACPCRGVVPLRAACIALIGFAAWTASTSGPIASSQEPPVVSPTVEGLIDQGMLAEASMALRERIESEGETAPNLLLRGLILYRQERYDTALAALQRSFGLDEGNPDTSKALGLCLVKMGREDLAETFFEIVVGLAPADPAAHYYLGLNAYTTRRFDLAAERFERSVSLDPDSVDGRSFLGRSYEAIGEIDRAARHYSRANELNRASQRQSAGPALLLGSLLFRQARLDQAEQHLREALQYDEKSALAHYWLGLVLEKRSEDGGAIDELERAASLAPDDHRPHYALARIHRKTGNTHLADASLRKFRELRVRSEVETF